MKSCNGTILCSLKLQILFLTYCMIKNIPLVEPLPTGDILSPAASGGLESRTNKYFDQESYISLGQVYTIRIILQGMRRGRPFRGSMFYIPTIADKQPYDCITFELKS